MPGFSLAFLKKALLIGWLPAYAFAQTGVTPPLLPPAEAAFASPSSLSRVNCLERVAVLHEGRLKPMDTFARHMLLQFSGRTTYQKSNALQVLARILFAPESVVDYRIFLIDNPEAAQALGVAPEKSRRYAFRDLEKALPKLQELTDKANGVEEEKRDLVQKEILRVYENLIQFVGLSRTFSFALPDRAYTIRLPETKEALRLSSDKSVFSFWELMGNASLIARILEEVGTRSEARRTPLENEVIGLSRAMYLNSHTLRTSPLQVLPISGSTHPGWQSPPEAITAPEQTQVFYHELQALTDAVKAYREGRQDDFDKAVGEFRSSTENRAYAQLQDTHFSLEIAYQKTQPFFNALILYWLSLLVCFTFFLLRRRWIYQAALMFFLVGYAIHLAGIVSRILIMHRPPVTSLYETFPFVAAVAILASLFIERMNRKGTGLLTAALLGVILLSIANRYAAEGDTMHMLVAVLNSNFWLSTHVICVTIGYSACLLAGAIGHIWLIRALLPASETKSDRLKEIGKMVYGTLCFGLLFSFIGTVLGGIWADQSWGRFWGWDPKENGALLIVVWCVILLHAKQWGYIRNPGLALGSIFGAIVVSLAWFGVNLLNVGLHSYGFTSGAATKLFSYIGLELVFMAVCSVLLHWRKQE